MTTRPLLVSRIVLVGLLAFGCVKKESDGGLGEGGQSSGGAPGRGGSSAGGGRGGGPALGEGGSGGQPEFSTTIVARCDFDGEDESGCEFDGWLIDNTLGSRGGSAAHAPPLRPGDSVSATFACADQAHSQIRFWLDRRDVQRAVTQQNLELYVDGRLYHTFDTYAGYREHVINVPLGAHEYRFVANSEIETEQVHVLDGIVCSATEPAPGHNGRVSFDDGFVPVELEQGDWLIDNLLGVRDGEAALHPPPMKPGDVARTVFDCNGAEHTQLRFYLDRRDVQRSLDDVNLELYLDGKLYHTFDTYAGYREHVINVPRGQHEYEFVSNVEIETQNLHVLDGFVCNDVEPAPGDNGRVSFDDGFVPVELEQGDWLIDNLLGVQGGEAALHPPPMKAGDVARTVFDCNGAEHTQLRFYLDRRDVQRSLDDVNLELYLDGKLYHTFDTYAGYREHVINVPRGQHEYEFVSNVEIETQNLHVLDGFVCNDVEPAPGNNGRVNFDDGFIPVELEQGDWLVDNLLGVHDGEAALHPRPMLEGDTASTVFDCGGLAHTRLSFWIDLRDTQRSVEQLNLKFSVDGELHTTFDSYAGYRQIVVEGLADTPHEYRFEVSTQLDSQNLYVLDEFACE